MIHEFLAEGAGNAKSGRDLAKLLDVNIRVVTKQIEKERREGWPICARAGGDPQGYFLASSPEEVETYCRQLLHRGGELFKTRRALLAVLERLKQAREREEAQE